MNLVVPSDNLPQQSDADLAARCARTGDPAAFHELTLRYYRPVCAFLFRKLQQPDLVEDLAQETFLEALTALRERAVPGHFSSWLFGIAHNRCGKWFRRKKPGLFPGNDPPELAVTSFVSEQEALEEQQKLSAALEGGLAGLPPQTRQLLDLKHREGLTCEEIAAKLGQPVGTIKSTLARTYKALRARMADRGEPGA